MWPEAINSGTSLKIQVKFSYHFIPPRATRHELQRNLQLATPCAGLGYAQVRPRCKARLAAVIAEAGDI